MKTLTIIILVIVFLINLNLVSASVGVGISPSKLVDSIQSGEVKEYTYTVYNTGNRNITAKLRADGEISDITEFHPTNVDLIPEPEPHRLPPVNGKQIKVRIKAPKVKELTNVTGTIQVSVNPGFGGFITTGAVSTRVRLEVNPGKKFLGGLTKKESIGVGVIALIILLILANLRYIKKKYKRN